MKAVIGNRQERQSAIGSRQSAEAEGPTKRLPTADCRLPRQMDEAPVQSYRDLRVWREAMVLAEMCYRHTRNFPRDELFGLTAQIRRAAASIPANIAEGYGREQTKSYMQFLRIAQGSCKEVETHLLLADRVLSGTAGNPGGLLDQAEIVGKMLRGLIRSLEAT